MSDQLSQIIRGDRIELLEKQLWTDRMTYRKAQLLGGQTPIMLESDQMGIVVQTLPTAFLVQVPGEDTAREVPFYRVVDAGEGTGALLEIGEFGTAPGDTEATDDGTS